MADLTLRSRYRGCLLGLAVGDALGSTLEFQPPGSFEPLEDLVGGGPFHLQAGQWTDDTSMALCLADSLLCCDGFDAADQMNRYLAWYRSGYLSSAPRCVDVGNTVRAALEKFARDGHPFAGSSRPDTAGNGSLMRVAPVALFFAGDGQQAIEMAALSSKTTHAAEEAVDACRYFVSLILAALEGKSKDELLAPPGGMELSPRIAEVANGSYKEKYAPRGGPRAADEVRGSCYVVDSLEAALWAFHQTDDFRSGALAAANLGDDADTTASVFGQIAGAFYGEEGLPPRWRSIVARREEIINFADRLWTRLAAAAPRRGADGGPRPTV